VSAPEHLRLLGLEMGGSGEDPTQDQLEELRATLSTDLSSEDRARIETFFANADRLGLDVVPQANYGSIKDGDSAARCVNAANARRDGNKNGIQVWHELKTVVLELLPKEGGRSEVVFAHVRANRHIVPARVAAIFGARMARPLDEHTLSRNGWSIGRVNPLTTFEHRHVFDLDVAMRYSHRGQMWTNCGTEFASARFCSDDLVHKMEAAGLAQRAQITEAPSRALELISRMLRARLMVVLGNPPFLAGDYLNLWLQTQHEFVHRLKETGAEILSEDRVNERPLEPDGDQWFIPCQAHISSRGGPINQIATPYYRKRIQIHDLREIRNFLTQRFDRPDIVRVLDIPDPSSAAHFDHSYRGLARGKAVYYSIFDSVKQLLRDLFSPSLPPYPIVAQSLLNARSLIAATPGKPRIFVLAGRTTCDPSAPFRCAIVPEMEKHAQFVFPDQHIVALQGALEQLKSTRSDRKAGAQIKKQVASVIFDPVYAVDEKTILLRMAAEFRCLDQENDANRYGKRIFLDCLEAHVYHVLNAILRGEDPRADGPWRNSSEIL